MFTTQCCVHFCPFGPHRLDLTCVVQVLCVISLPFPSPTHQHVLPPPSYIIIRCIRRQNSLNSDHCFAPVQYCGHTGYSYVSGRCAVLWRRCGHCLTCASVRTVCDTRLWETGDVDTLGLLVDSEIVLLTRYGKVMVFINKTLSTETSYQQDLINRDLLSTRLIVGKVGSGMWCGKFNITSNVLVCETQRKVNMYGCVSEWVGSVCLCVVCVCPLCSSLGRWSKVLV